MSTPKAARPRSTEEADFQRAVIDLAKILGLEVYHVPDSRRATAAGFPDLVIRGASGCIFRELKSETGRLSKDQMRWIDSLAKSGLNVGVWRPHDLATGRVSADLRSIR